MKTWSWIDKHFGTPQTAEDWIYFILIYGAMPVVSLWLLIITL